MTRFRCAPIWFRTLVFMVVASTTSCFYGWDVGPTPPASDAGSTTDAAPEASSECVLLIQALDEKRPSATACLAAMVGVECTERATDECGCPIGGINPVAFDDYIALVEAFNDAGCTYPCTACLSVVAPVCQSGPDGPHCK